MHLMAALLFNVDRVAVDFALGVCRIVVRMPINMFQGASIESAKTLCLEQQQNFMNATDSEKLG
jgi:hypothetical protein